MAKEKKKAKVSVKPKKVVAKPKDKELEKSVHAESKDKKERKVPYNVAAKKAVTKKAMKGNEEEVKELLYIKDRIKITAHNDLMCATFPDMKLNEEKFLAYVMANIGCADNGLPRFSGDVVKIARDVLEVNQTAFMDTLREMSQKITSMTVTLDAKKLNLLREHDGLKIEEAWQTIPLFTSFGFVRDSSGSMKVTCQLHPNLRVYLVNLTGNFTEIMLSFVLKARSVYTVRLGRLLMSGHFKGVDEVRRQVFTMPELAEHLSLPKSYARTYSEFNRRALSRAVEEINHSSEEINVLDYGKTVSAKDDVISIWFDTQRIGEKGDTRAEREEKKKKLAKTNAGKAPVVVKKAKAKK